MAASISHVVAFACYANHVAVSTLTSLLGAIVGAMDDVVGRACSGFPAAGVAYVFGYSRMHPFELLPLVVSGAPVLLYFSKVAFELCRSGVKACMRNLETVASICVFLLICRWCSCYEETAAFGAIRRSEYLEVLSSIMEDPEGYAWVELETRIRRVPEESEKGFLGSLPKPLNLFVALFLAVEFFFVCMMINFVEVSRHHHHG